MGSGHPMTIDQVFSNKYCIIVETSAGLENGEGGKIFAAAATNASSLMDTHPGIWICTQDLKDRGKKRHYSFLIS